MNTEAPVLSLIIPVYNEEPSLRELYERITATLAGLGQPYEVITVDDGSRDGSLELLRSLRGQDKRWRVVEIVEKAK